MYIQALIPLIIVIPLVVFWFWMFNDFVSNGRVPPNERTIWLIGFIFVGILTAGYYYFTVYREK